MTTVDVEVKHAIHSSWMIPVISDLIRYEYEAALKDDQDKRLLIEVLHRGFWGALLSKNPMLARSHYTHMAKEFAGVGLDLMVVESIDDAIFDNLSEMILVRSKTQRSKSRVDLKKIMQAAILRGEVNGWWHAHH